MVPDPPLTLLLCPGIRLVSSAPWEIPPRVAIPSAAAAANAITCRVIRHFLPAHRGNPRKRARTFRVGRTDDLADDNNSDARRNTLRTRMQQSQREKFLRFVE